MTGPAVTELVAIRRRRRSDAAEDVAAAWAEGAAVLVIDPTTSDAVAADLLRRARPSVLVHERPDGARRLTRLSDPVPLPVPGAAAVVATSGSSGPPRLVVLSAVALDASTDRGLARLGAEEARWALTLPLDHVAGLLVLRRATASGTTVEVHEGFDAGALVAGDAVWWALVPTMLRRVLETAADLRGRHVLLGGAAAPSGLVADARARGVEVVTSYGMTETCGGCVYDGVPLTDVEVAVVDDLVRVRGPVLATGTLTASGTIRPLQDADGWCHTSDLGHLVDGRLVVTGRVDDIVVTGGVNVATRRVAAVMEDAGATEVVVVGVPDDEWGQRLEAFVVSASPDPERWRAAVRATLGAAAVPKRVHVVDELPRIRLGKPDVEQLRSWALAQDN